MQHQLGLVANLIVVIMEFVVILNGFSRLKFIYFLKNHIFECDFFTVFESRVEKIILGDNEDKDQKDTHQMTFVSKNGLKSIITMGKEPYSYLPDPFGV